jgi:two-component system chemotaxis sensor kinase CheA
MNEFIRQFIIEARDYVEQASVCLAKLENDPTDAETLDSVFRAFHTLKGGASIVDFAAMERSVHAAEEVLTHARSEQTSLNASLIDACMICLDQVSRWVDTMETTEAIPARADGDAAKLVQRIRMAAQLDRAPECSREGETGWIAALAAENPTLRAQAATAVRFVPRASSFFDGEDPMALVASLPELLWMDAEVGADVPSLDELDPFECMMAITALSAADAEQVRAHFNAHVEECAIVPLAPVGEATSNSDLTDAARKLIENQLAVLAVDDDRTLIGRIGSVGLLAANVLRHLGASANADRILRAMSASMEGRHPEALCEELAAILKSRTSEGVEASLSTTAETMAVRTLRIDAKRVDTLVRLTGELAVVKNALGHAARLVESGGSPAAMLKEQHGVLEHLLGELQRAVLSIRVLPLRTVLQRFPRVVREMSEALNKPARLAIEGEDTEADKAIVEMLFEPLLHLVRNAMDHGIEAAGVRAQRGKPEVATLRIRASREGANVVIEIEDDGGGVDLERVRGVALERGIVRNDALDTMSDGDVLDLVFAPGFSTTDSVTEISGRGVGMDAVRTAVERVGGRVVMESRFGFGTTVRLTLPFSVMMTHVMTVEAGGQMFGIPLDAVVETVRVPVEAIAGVGAAKALVHRERTIPVLELADLLGVQETSEDDQATIVVATIAGQLGGIKVDRLGERMEVMLKPPEGLLAGVAELTGTTILGDGRVLLVLDLNGVLQ